MLQYMTLDELCRYVLHQVPEADPADVRRLASSFVRFPCCPSDAYGFSRAVELLLILKGVV